MSGQVKSELSGIRAAVFPVLSLAYLLLIFGLPLTLCAALWRQSGTKWQPVALLGCPFLYAVIFTLVAGLLSIPHQKGIIAGKFPRDVGHRVYFHRRLYGLCWTALFYFKPVYFLILNIDPLRRCTFRLFGYRGSLDFTIYPDTWIRDLPLLNFGDRAYIANRSTLGSNICLRSGEILVGAISIGDRSVVGHLGVIGLGSTMEADSELGVGVATGIQVRVGRNTKIGAISGLNHGSSVGNDCDIGAMSYIGSSTRVLDGVQLLPSSVSADHSVVRDETRVQANEHLESEPKFRNTDEMWLDRPEVRLALDAIRAATKSPNAVYRPNDSLQFDLGLDSLARVELAVALGKALNVDIEDRVVIESPTIVELVEAVLHHAGSSESPLRREHPIFDLRPSAAELKFLQASRSLSAPLWFVIGRVLELLGKVFFGLQVCGLEKLPQSGPFILCANHQSYLDPPFVLSVLPWRIYKKLFIVGASEIFGKGIFRLLAKTLRLYPVDPGANLLPAMRISAQGLRRGMGLLLYPEGERSVDGEPKRFKRGAGLLAARMNVPIYPVAIEGFFEAWPRGTGLRKFATLKIKFGDPILGPSDVSPEEAEEVVTERVRLAVVKMWEELRDGRCNRNCTTGPAGAMP
jgi:1-acyl-sn-glycerol-3-phosphate acyltransferase